MKQRFRILPAALLLAFCWTILPPPALAQDSGSAPAPQPPPSPSPSPSTEKKKKVWTEEDLRRIHGGVSVVGEADKAPPKGKKAAPGDNTAKAEEASQEEPPERPPCASWSWAAAVDAVLVAQGINLGRDYWMGRSYGGDICTSELGSVAVLAKRVEGDYVLEDQSKIHVQADIFPGNFSDVIASQENSGIMNIVVYKGHPYVTTGYTGVRWVTTAANGASVVSSYELKTLTMTDPYEGREERFDVTTGNMQDFQIKLRFVVKRR